MPSSSTGYRDKGHEPLILNPDSMSTDELFHLSLHSLSKGLPHATSSRRTLAIYLRWLQEHCQHPSSLTQSWENTLLHWTQSLHSRGFRESEITGAVEDWQEGNLRFAIEGRPQIRKRDVRRAFDQINMGKKEERRDRDRHVEDKVERFAGDSWRPSEDSYRPSGVIRSAQTTPSGRGKNEFKRKLQENFEQPPPPGYICNRCGKKGM